jgi:hypothetical protein
MENVLLTYTFGILICSQVRLKTTEAVMKFAAYSKFLDVFVSTLDRHIKACIRSKQLWKLGQQSAFPIWSTASLPWNLRVEAACGACMQFLFGAICILTIKLMLRHLLRIWLAQQQQFLPWTPYIDSIHSPSCRNRNSVAGIFSSIRSNFQSFNAQSVEVQNLV